MKKKKLLIVHNSYEIIKKIQNEYEENEFIKVVGTAIDGQALLKLNNLDNYDIVIVKNALSYITGLYALEILLKTTKQRPSIIILITPFINEFVHNKCSSLGIDYIPDFNIECNKIIDIINYAQLNKLNQSKLYFDTSAEIILLLKQLGLLRSYLGYTYFEYTLNVMFENNVNIYKKMQEIYKMISEHFEVTSTSVEKAMRSCIKSSFSQNNTFYARILFGHNIDSSDFPSTSIFIQVCIKTLKELKQTIINNNIRNSVRKI
ncbi:MAG: spo0A [Haloplasmataceae bacterium]|jgi:CheY-like chemotaxis protein|nr:spo0A [Haloplasmataceae bacterium]